MHNQNANLSLYLQNNSSARITWEPFKQSYNNKPRTLFSTLIGDRAKQRNELWRLSWRDL